MKKICVIGMFTILLLLFWNNTVNAQTLELPYGEFFTDYSTSDLGTAKVEIPDELTLKTEGTQGTGITLDYWYEADGYKVLDGYDYGLYLTAFIPTVETIEAPFDATITLTLPSKFNQEDFKIMYNGQELPVVHNQDGSITFVASVGTTYGGAFQSYFNQFDGCIFLKNAGNTQTSDENKTITTNSSSEVETTINAENSLPSNSTLSVKEVEIPSELKTTEQNLKKLFDISVLDSTGAVIEVKDNKMTITMALDEELKNYNSYEVVYIENGVVVERLDATVSDGKLTFITNHLSEYGIVAYNTVSTATKDITPKTGNNAIVYIPAILVVALVSLVIINKKENN